MHVHARTPPAYIPHTCSPSQLLRLGRIVRYLRRHARFYGIFLLTFVYIFIIHFITCMWIAVVDPCRYGVFQGWGHTHPLNVSSPVQCPLDLVGCYPASRRSGCTHALCMLSHLYAVTKHPRTNLSLPPPSPLLHPPPSPRRTPFSFSGVEDRILAGGQVGGYCGADNVPSIYAVALHDAVAVMQGSTAIDGLILPREGLIHSQTQLDDTGVALFLACMYQAGTMFMCFFVGVITILLSNYSSASWAFRRKIEGIKSEMGYYNLPEGLQTRIKAYYEVRRTVTRAHMCYVQRDAVCVQVRV